MNIYLVGGAVRDQLLGLDVSEKDWVVVGSTPKELISKGYKQVGKGFPVFLHPKTQEEYALARTERKSGVGYHGFDCFFSPEVTLEEDLLRRDLTINAIAMGNNGELIDPYNGRRDLKLGILRHVSDAFKDDPLRLLRVARFASKFEKFNVSCETLEMMRSMRDELPFLPRERIWKELSRTLELAAPWRFFEVLKDAGVLKDFFPENINYGDTFKGFCEKYEDLSMRMSILYAKSSYSDLKCYLKKVCVSKQVNDSVCLVHSWVSFLSSEDFNNPEKQWYQFKNSDAQRRPDRLQDVLTVACFMCSQKLQPRLDKLAIAQTNFAHELIKEGYQGAKLGQMINTKGIQVFKDNF